MVSAWLSGVLNLFNPCSDLEVSSMVFSTWMNKLKSGNLLRLRRAREW